MSNTMQDQPFQYPSPKSRNPDEPHRHSLSTSVPQDRVPLHSQPIPHRPELSRSESTPQFAHSRPIPIRTHTATHRPTAVRPSVDFASQPGSSRGQSRTMDDDEREELTTKGRKRKRLAKACSACHKNKRRCDGFAPCSNCEFSSRPCLYVNAQGEIIPPPRTRDSSSSAQVPRASKSEGSKNPERGNSNGNNDSNDGSPSGGRAGGDSDRRGSFDQEQDRSRGFADPLEAVDRDPSLSQDLIQIFFDRMHPYGSMLHPPTFHQRHYLSTVSPLLLDSIYAMSAHLSLHPALLSTLPPSCPVWARGEAFAERAKNSAQRFIDLRRSGWSEEDHAQHRGTWDETEFVQALYLLSVYFASMRQAPLGLYFLDIAIDIIKPKSSSSIYKPVAKAGSMVEHLTLLECRNRTFWLLLVHDLCASANGRARRLSDQDVYHVPLPGDESHWERYGGGSSAIQGRSEDRSQGAREVGDKRRDGLAVGSGNWSGDEGQIGELGHVIRILSIFSDIMCVANNSSAGTESKGNPAQHEQALKSWALSLPRHLRFDENNLGLSVAKLNSQVHTISRAGWLFCYMHAVAECGMFYLQAALAGGGNSSTSHASQFTAQRQGQAVDNIAVILDSMGQRGRESPLMLFPLLVVSNWHDHLRSAPVPPTPQQMMLDERLVVWWQEATRDWGFERRSTMNHGLYPTPAAPPTTNYGRSLSTSPLVPTLSGGAPRSAPMGLGLFGTSPPMANTRAPESALSVGSSTITLPTPKTGTLIGPGSDLNHRYSTGGLPPPLSFNRPRSNTTNSFGMSIRSPSPPPAHSTSSSARKDRMSISEQVSSGIAIRRLPSLSTERSEIKLPSINIPSSHHTPTILESPFGGSNASMGSLGSVGGFSGIGGQDRWQSMSALFSQSLPSISPRERYLEKERDEYFKRERQRDRQRDRDAEDIDMDGTGQEGTRASGPKDGSWGRDAKRDKREEDEGQDLSPRYKAYPGQDKSYYQTHSRNMSNSQHLVSPTSRAWEEDEPREYHPQPRRSSQARPNQEPPAQTSGQSGSTGPTSIHSFWDRYKRDPTGTSGHAGESAGPVGIAALVSAAEEKSRERESVKVQVEA